MQAVGNKHLEEGEYKDPVWNIKAQGNPKTEDGARTLSKTFQQTSLKPNHWVTLVESEITAALKVILKIKNKTGFNSSRRLVLISMPKYYPQSSVTYMHAYLH